MNYNIRRMIFLIIAFIWAIVIFAFSANPGDESKNQSIKVGMTVCNIFVPGVDNLVIIDDSFVRGTTLKQSIIGILDRLGPKKNVIVSSSPQVRYPDYYGIDMAKMSEIIAFRAAVELLKERDMKDVIAAAYR